MVQQENSLPVPMKSRKRSLESEGSILTFLIAILLFFWYLKLKDQKKTLRDNVERMFERAYESTQECSASERAILSQTIQNTIINSEPTKQVQNKTLSSPKINKKKVKINDEDIQIRMFRKSSPPCFINTDFQKNAQKRQKNQITETVEECSN